MSVFVTNEYIKCRTIVYASICYKFGTAIELINPLEFIYAPYHPVRSVFLRNDIHRAEFCRVAGIRQKH